MNKSMQHNNLRFIDRLIYSNGVAKISFTLDEFKSPNEFSNEITFFLLHVAKRWFNPKEFRYIILHVEFYNNKTLIETTFNYGLSNDITKFKQIFKEFKDSATRDKNFLVKVTFNEEDLGK
uniref:Uncharacterized protein n=1 Tax=Fusarium begoniae TaxID=48487 RepID=A0A6M4AZY2_9HYPO|nr:hypothetical protein [Fusarium begoniae]